MRQLGRFGAIWGVGGVLFLLLSAVFRLTPMAVDAARTGLSPLQWAIAGVVVVLMAYSEGYKGFQKQFSPRVVARALVVTREPTPLRVLLAPAFCMGLFDATRKRLIVSWSITTMVVVLVILVRLTPQPWRGIIDAGVVIGLGWGCAAIVWFVVEALRGHTLPVEPDVPVAVAS